jgi:hypothetical protein
MLENEGPPSITLARHNTQMLEEWKVVVCTQIRKQPSLRRLVPLHYCNRHQFALELWNTSLLS